MPQNLMSSFDQMPTNITNNTTTRLPPIQTLTQYCYTPTPVPFIPLFPPKNTSTPITHVANISPIKSFNSNLIFHQVNPNPVPTIQNQHINTFKTYTFNDNHFQSSYYSTPKKKTQCMPNHLTFVNIDLTTQKTVTTKQAQPLIESSFKVSSVTDDKLKQEESRRNPMDSNFDSVPAHRRKNKKQSSTIITMETPEETCNSFRATSNRNLPKQAVSKMKEWLFAHQDNPYPTEEEKLQIQNETGLNQKRINYWFINARRRLLPNTEKKRPQSGSNDVENSDPKRRKNSIVSMSSSTNTNGSSYSNYISTETSEIGSIESDSSVESLRIVESWVVDCLLNLRQENKP